MGRGRAHGAHRATRRQPLRAGRGLSSRAACGSTPAASSRSTSSSPSRARKIVIKPGPDDSDSFLASLLPGDGLPIGTDLTVGFSTTQGLYFGGSGGLEIAIPAHIQLGPVEILSAMIAVKFRDGGIPIELGATIKGDLLGAARPWSRTSASPPRSRSPPTGAATSGRPTSALGFKPPNGVGLAIDAGVVKGGGYLYLDFDKGEYAGALELVISNFLSLRAIGLINTKLPGGQPGFSMLVIITAEFSPGFQLGLRLHADRRRRPARAQPRHAARAARQRRPHRRRQQHPVPDRHHRQRPEDHQRPAGDLPAEAGHVPDRPDGEDRLGHADADLASRSG